MIKYVLILFAISLSACTTQQDLRPPAIIKSEAMLYQGIKAYQQEHYHLAIQLFKKSHMLYQSIDDQKGQAIANYNLIEAALAVHQLALVKQTINQLDPSDNKSQLLARYLFANKNYQAALLALPQTSNNTPDLNQDLIRLKFAIFAKSTLVESKYKAIKEQFDSSNKAQKALFNRLESLIAVQNNQPEKALNLLKNSLSYYKSMANRRAIATCLQEISIIYSLQKDPKNAEDTLKRALLIRTWLKDGLKIQKLQGLLRQYSNKSTTKNHTN